MIDISEERIGDVRMRLIERGKGGPITMGPFFLLTHHADSLRYYGLKFLGNRMEEALGEFNRACERESARQAAEHEQEAKVG